MTLHLCDFVDGVPRPAVETADSEPVAFNLVFYAREYEQLNGQDHDSKYDAPPEVAVKHWADKAARHREDDHHRYPPVDL